MLELDAIRKDYPHERGVIEALRPTSTRFDAGEFVAIVGPSGSGKSTLLSILGGMLAPTSGRVVFQGQSLYEIPLKQRSELRNRQIGFLFQSFNLVPYLTAAENVQLPMSLFGTDRGYQVHHARQLLEEFGLAERLDHKPSELSAGQQQRVAMARTLAMSPKLVLADEPTGNLDPESRNVVLTTLHDQCKNGRTIILVTHDKEVADTADRVINIREGRATEESGPATVREAG